MSGNGALRKLPVILSVITLCWLSNQAGTVALANGGANLSDQQGGELQATVLKNPDAFGGLWGDPATGVLTINISGSVTSSRRAAAIQALNFVGSSHDPFLVTKPKKWVLQFHNGGPSLALLNSLANKIPTTQPWDSYIGATVLSWYVDPVSQRVVIGVSEITDALRQAAESTFGGLAVLIVGHQGTLLYDRIHDGQAYSGSDRIVTSDGNYCSAGYKAYISVSGVLHYGMITAGHCWSNGTTVSQGYYDCNAGYHSFGTMGKVTRRVFGNNVTDVEFLDGTATGTSTAANMWYGSEPNPCGPETSNSGPINDTGVGSNYVGESVCFDGSVTGENCNGVIDATLVCVTVQGTTSCNQDRAHSGNGSLATGGDSGGPVEANNGHGTGVLVFGTISSVVGSEWYYSDATYELNAMSAGLATS